MRNSTASLAALSVAALLVSSCQNAPTLSDSRKGPLFCDDVPDPKRYFTVEEVAALGDDMVDWVLTIQTRGKKYCGWGLAIPVPSKDSGLKKGPN